MGSSKKKMNITKEKNSADKSKSDYQDVFTKLDSLRTNIKGEHSKIDHPSSNKQIQLVAVAFIIIVGMAGVFILYNPNSILKPASNNNSSNNNIIVSLGNFKEDTSVSSQPLFFDNKLSIVYVGGEFCPYCAVERWALVLALSHFGTFSNLSQLYSYEGNVPTYKFSGSTYTSNTIKFEPVEEYGNVYNSQTQQYNKINNLNPIQSSLFKKYSGGYFPFVCIGGAIFEAGSGPNLSPTSFNKYTFDQIQSQISSKTGLFGVINAESNTIISLINKLLATQSASTTTNSTQSIFVLKAHIGFTR